MKDLVSSVNFLAVRSATAFQRWTGLGRLASVTTAALGCALFLVPFCRPASAATPESEEFVRQGNTAFKNGDRPGAISFFTKAITADPSNHLAYYNRGRIHDTEARFDQALADYDQLLKLRADDTRALALRGALHLRQGRFEKSLEDFDRYLKLLPTAAPHHWQRGLALYFTGRYADARRQFELCHTVKSNDVEHAAWHFACVARTDGLEKARASLLPVSNDWRVPLMQVHAFLAGKATTNEVFAPVRAAKPDTDDARTRNFFAEYYLGLYHEAAGQSALALQHIEKAIADPPRAEFMVDVARAHAARLRKPKP